MTAWQTIQATADPREQVALAHKLAPVAAEAMIARLVNNAKEDR